MNLAKLAASTVLVMGLLGGVATNSTEAATRVRARRTTNATQGVDYNLTNTGKVFEFSYEASPGTIEDGTGIFLTSGSSAPSLTSSGVLSFTLLVEDVLDNIDIQLSYEYEDVLSVNPKLDDELSIQNIVDFIAAGNNNNFDVFDDIDEEFDVLNLRELESTLLFGLATQNSHGEVSFATLTDAVDKAKVANINSEYSDESLFIDGEPFNEFGSFNDDLLFAFDDNVDVPEPGTLMGFLMLVSTGLGQKLLLRKRKATV